LPRIGKGGRQDGKEKKSKWRQVRHWSNGPLRRGEEGKRFNKKGDKNSGRGKKTFFQGGGGWSKGKKKTMGKRPQKTTRQTGLGKGGWGKELTNETTAWEGEMGGGKGIGVWASCFKKKGGPRGQKGGEKKKFGGKGSVKQQNAIKKLVSSGGST